MHIEVSPSFPVTVQMTFTSTVGDLVDFWLIGGEENMYLFNTIDTFTDKQSFKE